MYNTSSIKLRVVTAQFHKWISESEKNLCGENDARISLFLGFYHFFALTNPLSWLLAWDASGGNVLWTLNAHITSTQRYFHVGVDQGREALNKNIRFNMTAPRK